ncbi:hypothetical protein [Neobacillus sp. YIM B06451]|uniref:hypothetical protein n=1 Tax=Neobacillus sp. YIM B06451 TaxID=3070994 RepID=UPI00292D09B6|nr:hypothetical protein [Neobacillus sp. YIM B06451]
MKKILQPKPINGTTRFYFETKFGFKTFMNLLEEFKNEHVSVKLLSNSHILSFKLINKIEPSAIELTPSYISFFPKIEDKQQIEELRERIYKHVAKRSDVYRRTSKENEELSITSLITGDLRACASLLYYCLHKLVSSLMYDYFNEHLRLDDHEIEHKEVEHFTSGKYLKYFRNGLPIEPVNKQNYLTILGHRVKPFKLLRYIISDSQLFEVEKILIPYIEVICKKMFSIDFYDPALMEKLDNKINEYNRLTEKSSQEEEVDVGIALAMKQYKVGINNSLNALLLLDILALRLYWLRQTADYAYDFEVKTSSREMSVLLATVQKLISILSDFEQGTLKENKEIIKEPNHAEQSQKYKQEHSIQQGGVSKDVKFFYAPAKFPDEIKVNRAEVFIYMTAIHVDSSFDKEDLLEILNLHEGIRNEGKYFVFESKNPLTSPLYLYINDDGRWTLWFSNKDKGSHFLSNEDLIFGLKELIDTIKEGYKERFNEDVQFNIVSSLPILNENPKQVDAFSILELNHAINNKITILEHEVTNCLRKILKLEYVRKNTLGLLDMNLEIKINFSGRNDVATIPWFKLIENKVNEKKQNTAYLSILIEDSVKDPLIQDRVEYAEAISSTFINEFGYNSIIRNEIVLLTPQQLNEFLNEKDNDSQIIKGVSSLLNEIAYQEIHLGIVDQRIKSIIELSIEIYPSYSYPIATLGTWYFRNNELTIEESRQKGIEMYSKSILLEKNQNENSFLKIEQKYYLELALFQMERELNIDQALKTIEQGLLITEDAFRTDLLELQHKCNEIQYPIDQASSSNEFNALFDGQGDE